ncbi:Inner membrane protein yhjX [Dermatophilus congolensis]|uniref:Inner membrane protein yhjX n=1 Tax=Dermatophilus congolensis TaxID=1863 RepID=A0AA46BLM5_9MICO|nr:OFA family MFS transporter [Dermatophilus congolensis]STD04622.1 Inner membrane protein yhjX [Dermatophilus congolensis]
MTSPSASPTSAISNRWIILAGGILVQLALGAIYAWSTFGKALQAGPSAMHLSAVQAALPFELALGMIFIGTFVGGRIQDARGPRIVAVVGVVLYAIGIIISSFATTPGDLWLLLIGYGLISGLGLGMAYIVPIALLQKWFPDKAGLITGLAVAGFGFGAVITSPVAQMLIESDPVHPTAPFLPLGIAYLIFGVLGSLTFVNPPSGWRPAGMPAPSNETTNSTARDFTVKEALSTPQWYLLTLILTLSTTAGITLVSGAAAAAANIAGYSAAAAAALVGIMGLFNGAGRILWAALSDRVGKMNAFVGILALQGICLILMPHLGTSAAAFAVLAAIIYTCYGGGFGAMPSTAGKFFGLTHSGSIYGLMLVAWSLGGVGGPLLSSALIGGDAEKNYMLGYTVIGVIALVGAVIPFLTKPPKVHANSTF